MNSLGNYGSAVAILCHTMQFGRNCGIHFPKRRIRAYCIVKPDRIERADENDGREEPTDKPPF